MSKSVPFYRKIQTELDLNGPTLNMQTQPVGTSCSVTSGIATFIGIGTAIYPPGQAGRNTNTGSLTHQWFYRPNPSASLIQLNDGGTSPNITGSGTTTLTLSGLTYDDNGSSYLCQVDYTPNDLSPNAINEPFNSAEASLTVFPIINITTQPTNTTTLQNVAAIFTIDAIVSDNTTSNFSYQWVLDDNDLTDGPSDFGFVSGSRTKTLSISRNTPNLYKVSCKISHPRTIPGTISSSEVNLDVSSSRGLIKYERFGDGTSVAEKGERQLGSMGALSFRANTDANNRTIVVYAPEEDVSVKITMGGAAGESKSGYQSPGEGGLSVFRTTLKKNEEYVIQLGVNESQGGGPRGGLSRGGTSGGGVAAIYHRSKLLAVCGGGGGGGISGRGGFGGGLQVAGENGGGSSGGIGGQTFTQGTIPAGGMTQAGRTGPDDFDPTSIGGGRIGGCTTGSRYWRNQGFSPCQDIPGNTQFRNANGILNTETATIQRGFKSGQSYINNGGSSGGSNLGAGGAGANGGSGATSNGAGGGGGSGYSSAEVELLSSSVLPTGTRLGGNNEEAFIAFELFVSTNDQVPFVPPDLQTVTFNVNRGDQTINRIELEKQSGDGAFRIQFGPNGGNVTTQIGSNAVYKVVTGGSLRTRSDGGIELNNNFSDRPLTDFDRTKFGAQGFGQADVDELWDRGHSYNEIKDYILAQRAILGDQFGTGADAWLISLGEGFTSVSNFDKTQYGAFGFGQADVDELWRRGHSYAEISAYVDQQRAALGNQFGTGADEWLISLGDGNGQITTTNFDKTQYGRFGFGQADVDELLRRGHNYPEIRDHVREQRRLLGAQFGTGADAYLVRAGGWYGQKVIRGNSGNGPITSFDPTLYGAFGFGQADVDELLRRGHNYNEISTYVREQRAILGDQFGTGADAWLAQALIWYQQNASRGDSGIGQVFDKSQFGVFGFGQADVDELVKREYTRQDINSYVIRQRSILGSGFGTGADEWLISMGPGAGPVDNFEPSDYGAFGFGQADVDELWDRGHNYNEISAYVGQQRAILGDQFGTGADEWLISLGGGIGEITTTNFDKTQYGAFGFGQADVVELLRRGHNYPEISAYVGQQRAILGDQFGTGADAYLSRASAWYSQNAARGNSGIGPITSFDPTLYGAFGFGQADVDELLRRGHNYREIKRYVEEQRAILGDQFGTGADAWLDQAEGWAEDLRVVHANGHGNGKISSGFDTAKFGAFGFGQADVDELLDRGHNYDEILEYVLEQRVLKGAQFGTGADAWLNSNSPAERYFYHLQVTPNLGSFIDTSTYRLN